MKPETPQSPKISNLGEVVSGGKVLKFAELEARGQKDNPGSLKDQEITGGERMSTITAGVNLFQTKGNAYFTIPHGLALPENFFEKGSAPFTGIIRFRGFPLRRFHHNGREFKTGLTDTIVAHPDPVEIGVGKSAESPIELVALSLRSAEPIEVEVGTEVELWDVRVFVSKKKRSTGKIIITQHTDQGGVFNSELTIYPHFVFERHSDGEERQFDTGATEVPSNKLALVSSLNILRAMEVPFQTSAPKNVLAIPALTNNFVPLRISHHSHEIVAAKGHFLQ